MKVKLYALHDLVLFCTAVPTRHGGLGADVDTNALAFIGRLAGEHSTEYELSQYYITGAWPCSAFSFPISLLSTLRRIRVFFCRRGRCGHLGEGRATTPCCKT